MQLRLQMRFKVAIYVEIFTWRQFEYCARALNETVKLHILSARSAAVSKQRFLIKF